VTGVQTCALPIFVAVICNLTGCLGANRNLRDIGNLFLELGMHKDTVPHL
jgi:hypothetical protein